MAIGAVAIPPVIVPAGAPGASFTSSVKSDWVTLHTNIASAVAASTSTVLKTILSVSLANVQVARVPPSATRCLLRARYAIAVTALTTQPVVQLYSIFGDRTAASSDDAPAFATGGTVRWMRVDAATIAAAGTTLTLAPSTDSLDTAYGYSDPYDLTGFDLKGGLYVMGLVKTAAVISGGAGAIELQALFLN